MIIKLNTIHYCALSILLLASGISFSAHAGAAAPSSFGDFVWADINGDGIQDPGEPGLFDVTVNICGTDDLLTIDCGPYSDSTSTDLNGDYLFTGIESDDFYAVWIDLATLPAGAIATTPTELFFMNNDGQPILTADFGFEILEVVVPVPAAIWLFGSGLLAFLGVARRKHAMK